MVCVRDGGPADWRVYRDRANRGDAGAGCRAGACVRQRVFFEIPAGRGLGVDAGAGGALLFGEVYGVLGKTLMTWLDLGPLTLPQLTGVPVWLIFGALGAGAIALFRRIERWERS